MRGGAFLAVLFLASACGGSRNEVSVEERLYLTIRHDPPGRVSIPGERALELEVEGNVVLEPGALLLYTAAPGDTLWESQMMYPGEEPGVFLGVLPPGRRGERAGYFFQARTPSGRILTLPEDLAERGAPYTARRWREVPFPIGMLMWVGIVVAIVCLSGAGVSAWSGLQRRAEPGAAEQARLARWVAAGTVVLLLSGGLLGSIHSWIGWGAPYLGFPFGTSVLHTKLLFLMVLWAALSWSAWGSLTRRTGARDLFPARLYAGLVLAALLVSLLVVLLPSSTAPPHFPPVPAGVP